MPPEPSITQIVIPTPFPVGDVNVFLYRGREALTLFDAAVRTEDAYRALVAGLAAHGVAVRDLERIILTHHHFDHIGLLQRLMAESGAQTCGHPDTLEELQLSYGYDDRHRTYHETLLAELGVPADQIDPFILSREHLRRYIGVYTLDRLLPDGVTVDGFTVHHVPGHSPTDTIYMHSSGMAVTGDHILENINPNPILRRPLPGRKRARSLVEFQLSLRRTRALNLTQCFPGHGAPFTGHHRVIDGILAQHERRNRRVLDSMPPEGVNAYELSRILYPSMTHQDLFFCLSVAVGQLELLASRGILREERDAENVLRFFPVQPHGDITPDA